MTSSFLWSPIPQPSRIIKSAFLLIIYILFKLYMLFFVCKGTKKMLIMFYRPEQNPLIEVQKVLIYVKFRRSEMFCRILSSAVCDFMPSTVRHTIDCKRQEFVNEGPHLCFQSTVCLSSNVLMFFSIDLMFLKNIEVFVGKNGIKNELLSNSLQSFSLLIYD